MSSRGKKYKLCKHASLKVSYKGVSVIRGVFIDRGCVDEQYGLHARRSAAVVFLMPLASGNPRPRVQRCYLQCLQNPRCMDGPNTLVHHYRGTTLLAEAEPQNAPYEAHCEPYLVEGIYGRCDFHQVRLGAVIGPGERIRPQGQPQGLVRSDLRFERGTRHLR